MGALIGIVWFVALLVSVCLVFAFVGVVQLVNMFPEGRRWWMLPAQIGSLAAFAAVVHFHPF